MFFLWIFKICKVYFRVVWSLQPALRAFPGGALAGHDYRFPFQAHVADAAHAFARAHGLHVRRRTPRARERDGRR